MTLISQRSLLLTVLVAAACLSGCKGHGQLMPTPNLYLDGAGNPFAETPPELRDNSIDVFYVTDRQPTVDEAGDFDGYSHKRSNSAAFGSALMQIGDGGLSWEQIVEASTTREREGDFSLHLLEVFEHGRLPGTPGPLVSGPEGFPVLSPEYLEQRDLMREAFLDELRRRLALTDTKEVYLFVHGYNNSFEHAVGVIGQLWHFMGRQGVPLAYTWPAGHGGLRGYFYDRESGEFTIYHLKELLRALTQCQELERIHLIAHSRGTDVTITALRELYLEFKDKLKPRSERRLANVILAAPDLDVDVIAQRILAEEFTEELGRFTIYMSASDVALGFSGWLFGSSSRMGRITKMEDFPPEVRLRAEGAKRGEFFSTTALIESQVETGPIGHSYFYSHPAASSDLILMLKYGRDPGIENGRPLDKIGDYFFRIYNDYPDFEREPSTQE